MKASRFCCGPPPIAHGKCSAAILYGVFAARRKTYASAFAAYQAPSTRRQKQEEPEGHRGWCTGCIGRVQIYAGATLMSARPHTFSFGSTGARESTCTSFDALRNESSFWPTVNQVLDFLEESERERERDRVKVEKFFQWN